jgi:RNA recognition motif-containing protein
MAVRLFIGNLPYDVTEAELRAHFAAVGPLASLALPTDRDTGKPRGFAFVEFSEQADAEEAIRRLNNQSFKGRLLAVNEARARDDRAPTGPPRTFTPRAPTSADTRTATPRAPTSADTRTDDDRSFTPDAAPRRRRTPARGAAKSERGGPKRPMYKRATGAVRFGAEDDDADEDARDEHDANRQENAADYDPE